MTENSGSIYHPLILCLILLKSFLSRNSFNHIPVGITPQTFLILLTSKNISTVFPKTFLLESHHRPETIIATSLCKQARTLIDVLHLCLYQTVCMHQTCMINFNSKRCNFSSCELVYATKRCNELFDKAHN